MDTIVNVAQISLAVAQFPSPLRSPVLPHSRLGRPNIRSAKN
jgi:hypothetical protein